MQYARLGKTGLDVSRICMGCMSFGQPNRGTHEWTEKTSELEEAFIYLMAGARDNFARDAA